MIRLNIIVEGDAEERFVNEVLSPHFGGFGITTSASKVVTSGRRGNAAAQGGGRRYGHWKDDLSSWIKAQGRDQSVWFTTMLDYYGLGAFVDEFPGYRETAGERRANDRVAKLESAWANDLNFERFIPYLQIHEFETLLLVRCDVLKDIFIEQSSAVDDLLAEVRNTGKTPEEINDGKATAPSKRIINHLAAYKVRKASAGPLAAAKIGLPALRQACPHFNAWVSQVESLTS